MSILPFDPNEKTIETSKARGNNVKVVTLKKGDVVQNPLLTLLQCLPPEIYSHCIRVSVVAKMLARKVKSPPKDMCGDKFMQTVFNGGLYHHIREAAVLFKNDLPKTTESLLRKHITSENICVSTIVDIVNKNCIYGADKHRGKSYANETLGVQLVTLVNTFDHQLADSEYSQSCVDKAVDRLQKSGEHMFGTDAMRYFDRAKEQIIELYLGQQTRTRDWA